MKFSVNCETKTMKYANIYGHINWTEPDENYTCVIDADDVDTAVSEAMDYIIEESRDNLGGWLDDYQKGTCILSVSDGSSETITYFYNFKCEEVIAYEVKSYYSIDHNGHPYGMEDSMETNDGSEATEFLWNKLNHGLYVSAKDVVTGETKTFKPDLLSEPGAEDDLWIPECLYRREA